MSGEKVCVNVLFFAAARELTGVNSTDLTITSETNLHTILQDIINVYNNLSEIREGVILSVNQEYLQSEENIVLNTGDEIAVIPPISGGNVFLIVLV